MNKRSVKTTKRNVSTRKPARKKTNTFQSVKSQVTSVVIWFLVVINAVLIFSLVQKILIKGTDTPAARTPVITVEVLNGCGIRNLASEFQTILERQNYKVVSTGNAPDFKYKNTVIIDRGIQDKKVIDKFVDFVGLERDKVLLIRSDQAASDVTLIIGADYPSLKGYRDSM